MRHRKNSKRLSRQSAHRKAVLRNQVKSLIAKEKIKTTVALAKESRRLAEKLITLGKKDTVASRRRAFSILADRDLVKILFSELAPRFNARNGGYTRIVRLGNRQGDNASLAILEFTERKIEEKKSKKAKKVKKKSVAKEEKKEDQAKKGTQEQKQKKEEIVKPEAKQDIKEKSVKEEKGSKGFLGGLRKFLKQDKTD